ncbi:helicase associated domain-containing protein [Pelagophyceae sp. CCMP2097]|nr:helicase associated domain-containing protein [Pelagophyceae sp. CCMP2097]
MVFSDYWLAALQKRLELSSWDARYLQLQAYQAAHGDSAIHRQRAAFKAGGLTPERLERLEAVAFVSDAGELSPERAQRLEAVAFVWDAQADGWDAHFELLQAYRKAHGDCAVPQTFATADGTKLGWWVNKQRTSYKAGELSPERVERLEAVGFAWRVERRALGTDP